MLSFTVANTHILTWTLLSPLLGIVLLAILGEGRDSVARSVSIASSLLTFLLSLVLIFRFESGAQSFQFCQQVPWLPAFGASYAVGIDGVSLWLIALTTLLTLLVLIASTSIQEKVKSYFVCILLLEIGMLGTLMALDGLTFYIFWELMLIPMYFLIGVWGGPRRIYAALKFVIYTALGSLLMLVAMVYLAQTCGEQFGQVSFFFSDWAQLHLGENEELWLFAAFALAFAIKVPVFPLHTWLPDAHVEAPTGGSVILAGVLLKMGLYGLIRIGIPVFPMATVTAAPIFAVLGVIGIIYGALVAWAQTDIKKLVAYSSVSHLGFCVLGYAALNLQGMQGSILQMLNHGISTAALFFIVGVLYERKHSREISYYGGLAQKIPLFAAVYMIFTLSSIGLPLTNGFVGEFLILLGGFRAKYVYGLFAVTGVILGAVYMLSLYRRVIFGSFDEEKNGDLEDLSLREKIVFLPLVILVFFVGIYPQPILHDIEPTTRSSLELLHKDEPVPIQETLPSTNDYLIDRAALSNKAVIDLEEDLNREAD